MFGSPFYVAAGLTSVVGAPLVSMVPQWHNGVAGTVCRLDQEDATMDGRGSSGPVKADSLDICKAQCELQTACYGVEYSSERCQIWVRPVGFIRLAQSEYSCWTMNREAASIEEEPHAWGAHGIVFFAVLFVQAVLNVIVSLPVVWVFTVRRMEVFSSWARRCKSWRHLYFVNHINRVDIEPQLISSAKVVGPEIAVVIPCYLPNEQGIIEETVLHIMKHLDAPGDLSVFVVYNTPIELPEVEVHLQSLSHSENLPRGRNLTVLRADDSSSKAENLNMAMQHIKAPFVAIYDADHHPDPNSLTHLYSWMKREDVDCVQGSTYIRNVAGSGILGALVDAEFFVVHFMQLPAAQFLTRQGFFGGSNALWDKEVLQSMEFRSEMQTEDIDISFRALLDLRRIGFCPEARSGELAPVDLRALFYQRLRWAIGWDQVALQQAGTVAFGRVHFSLRLGLIYYLYVRWLLTFTGLCAWIILPFLRFAGTLDAPGDSDWKDLAAAAQRCLLGVYVLSSGCCLVEAACQADKAWVKIPILLVFFLASPLYVVCQATILIISLWKSLAGSVTGWYVSPRSLEHAASQAASPRDAVLHGMHHCLAQTPDSAEAWSEEPPKDGDQFCGNDVESR